MGQKTSPIGLRTGITIGWQSTWFAQKAKYGDFLVEDQKIRQYVDGKFNRSMPKGAVAKVEIVRTRNEIKVTLHSARPGIVIGPRGGEVDKLREELEGLTGQKVAVNVIEIKEPDLNATLVGEAIAEQLSKRASFRRTMKQYCESAMNAGAKGVKITCSGRLAGSEMARTETQKLGSIPLHTLDANVDYAVATSKTTYGTIGVKVWIYKGKFGEEAEPAAPRRRRRAPTRRIKTDRKADSAAKAAPAQDSQSAVSGDVVAPPAKTDTKKRQTTAEQNSPDADAGAEKEN
jgi:small subunit ribosomal protein S3